MITHSRFITPILLSLFSVMLFAQTSIDRKAVVERHNIVSSDLNLQLPLGNGNFCVTVDGTGLQTFGGNIMSHDAWHTSPLPEGFTMQDVPETGSFQQGRCQPGQGDNALPAGAEKLRKWMFDNPHIANLSRIRLMRPGGVEIKPEEIKNLKRKLDLWNGRHETEYEIDGKAVLVKTSVSPNDNLVLYIQSDLISEGKLEIVVDFPYPTEQNGNWVGRFDLPDHHTTTLKSKKLHEEQEKFYEIIVQHQADDLKYTVSAFAKGVLWNDELSKHRFYSVKTGSPVITLDLRFDCKKQQSGAGATSSIPSLPFGTAVQQTFPDFWQTGGAIDLSGSTDPRWKELERRIVLSQYLLRVNTAGSWCSAEAGLLTTDNWRGQYHYEMVWWHLAHYALWDRLECSDEALKCYEKHKLVAKKLAEQLGYKGYKWGKSVGPEGRTAPWGGNQVLLWKQPHPMFFAELEYRNRPTRQTLEKWADILEGTAENMADYVTKDEHGVYHLDPVMPPGELGITKDTTFDLAYFRFGFDMANIWRQRLGKERNSNWDNVRKSLAPLPTIDADGGKVFVHSAEWLNSYVRRNWEHPDLIGFFGMLPGLEGVDAEIAKRTVRKVAKEWQWTKCWGWDFPWMAMAAAKASEPELAVDMLLHDSSRNRYDERGVCLGGPCPYLPGNGGLLYAIALMSAGWDNAPKNETPQNAPGFPQNGKWSVRFEGLKQAP